MLLNQRNSISPEILGKIWYQIMARANTKIGDIFSVKLDENRKKYFQLIAFDLTQLNSDVIRAFNKVYSPNDNPDLLELVSGEVEFHAHCVTKFGLKLGFWAKVGNIAELGSIDVLFRSCGDRSQKVKVSQDWWVWKVNEEQRQVGKLEGENRKAEIGSVIPPDSIVHRIKTGTYDFVYPEFE
ncbi:hypothetical protein F901_02603 [Acinetobacter dispersus]|nr:hypothetical protein F901_02603 [Acinetobacter dispersus]